MPVVFTKSAATSALIRSLSALDSFSVGVCFFAVHYFVSDLQLAVKLANEQFKSRAPDLLSR